MKDQNVQLVHKSAYKTGQFTDVNPEVFIGSYVKFFAWQQY